jgi:hypothetical protein
MKPANEPSLARSPSHNVAIIEWLSRSSEHPRTGLALWTELLVFMRADDTGEIESGFDWAERAGMESAQVAQVLDELVSINAIRRERDGERVRYIMNPCVATYIFDPDAQRAARERAGPLRVVKQAQEEKL